MTSATPLLPDSPAAAFPTLSKRDQRHLLATGRRLLGCDHLAQDALQEALIAMSQEARLPDEPLGWLTRAVVFRSRHLRRSVRRRQHYEHRASLDCELHADCNNPLHVAIAHEVGERLDAVRRRLPPDQQAAMHLFEAKGHGYEAIAAALGVPIGTVRSRLSRARLALSAVRDSCDQEG